MLVGKPLQFFRRGRLVLVLACFLLVSALSLVGSIFFILSAT